MALDDILNAKEKFNQIDGILEGINPRSERAFANPADAVYKLLEYGGGQVTPAQFDFMLSRTPAELGHQANGYFGLDKHTLIDAVKRDYNTAISNVPEKDILELVLGIEPVNADTEVRKKHRKYLDLRMGDLKAFFDSIGNRAVRDAVASIANTRPELLQNLAKATMEDFKREFLESFREGDNLDYSKIRDYITGNVDNYTDEQKQAVYLEIGKRVSK